jgi:hypothetical protein
VILSWHVDYWDYLGWKDPFGGKAFSLRQSRYAKARSQKNRWTPQFVVNSTIVRKADAVLKIVKQEAGRKPRLKFEAEAKLDKAGSVVATIRIGKLDQELKTAKEIGVVAVLFQRKAHTRCTAGENKGRTLAEYFLVLAALKPVPLVEALEKGVKATFKAPKGEKASNLGVAVSASSAGRYRSRKPTVKRSRSPGRGTTRDHSLLYRTLPDIESGPAYPGQGLPAGEFAAGRL